MPHPGGKGPDPRAQDHPVRGVAPSAAVKSVAAAAVVQKNGSAIAANDRVDVHPALADAPLGKQGVALPGDDHAPHRDKTGADADYPGLAGRIINNTEF